MIFLKSAHFHNIETNISQKNRVSRTTSRKP